MAVQHLHPVLPRLAAMEVVKSKRYLIVKMMEFKLVAGYGGYGSGQSAPPPPSANYGGYSEGGRGGSGGGGGGYQSAKPYGGGGGGRGKPSD